jgi:hypothetical protein
MHRYNAYIFAECRDMQFWGGAAMQRDAEAPVQNLLPLHLCSWRNTLQNIYGARILQTKMHAMPPGALWGEACTHVIILYEGAQRGRRPAQGSASCTAGSRAPDKDILSKSGPLLRICWACQGPPCWGYIKHVRAPHKDVLSMSGPLLRICWACQGPCYKDMCSPSGPLLKKGHVKHVRALIRLC